jgi:hypothetical protein
MRKMKAIAAAACVTMACWGSMTAIASLRHESGPADQLPPSVAETPVGPLINSAAASRLSPQDTCHDLEFSFVHSRCVKAHKRRHVARTSHRVATLVIGSAAASLSLPSASMRSATASQGRVLSSVGAAAQDLPRAGNDHVARKSNDLSVRRADEAPRTNKANVWSGSRDRRVVCRQNWTLYDRSCLRDQIHG